MLLSFQWHARFAFEVVHVPLEFSCRKRHFQTATLTLKATAPNRACATGFPLPQAYMDVTHNIASVAWSLEAA